jgi:hypothetical protein
MTILVALAIAFSAVNRLIFGSSLVSISFFVLLYTGVLSALFSTLVRYRNEQRNHLVQWRRRLYMTGLLIYSHSVCVQSQRGSLR